MSAILTNGGSPLFLNLQLDDGNDAQFPLAYIYDQDGNEISGSPFSLTNVANGLYTNPAGPNMPSDSDFVTATYKVFSDSGHTSLNTTYTIPDDIFVLNTTNPLIVAIGNAGSVISGKLVQPDVLVGNLVEG